jgi:hypothetical protein
LIYNVRKTVMGLVEAKGREELIRTHTPKDLLELGIFVALPVVTNVIINNKIRYVKELLRLVSDGHVFAFFNDLQGGLDNVVDQWDGSELDPRGNAFRFPPQRIKRRFIYRRKWIYS